MWVARFSIGTGRPSSVRLDLANSFIFTVKHDAAFCQFDKDVAAELELFILLYNGVISQQVTTGELHRGLGTWLKTNNICESNSCAYYSIP